MRLMGRGLGNANKGWAMSHNNRIYARAIFEYLYFRFKLQNLKFTCIKFCNSNQIKLLYCI